MRLPFEVDLGAREEAAVDLVSACFDGVRALLVEDNELKEDEIVQALQKHVGRS